jgi:hypothetical protein
MCKANLCGCSPQDPISGGGQYGNYWLTQEARTDDNAYGGWMAAAARCPWGWMPNRRWWIGASPRTEFDAADAARIGSSVSRASTGE